MSLWGFDTDLTLTSSNESCLNSNSTTYHWVGRYITSWTGSYTLQPNEVIVAHDAGLLICSIWMGARWSTSPLGMTGATGTQEGQMAVASANNLGQPGKTVIVLDIEDWNQESGDDFAGYCTNWRQAVSAGGYFPVIYANASTFTAMGSVANIFDGKWLATGASITSVPSGYSAVQGQKGTICGLNVDYDLMDDSAWSDWVW